MNLRKFACAASIVLAVASFQTASAETAGRWEQWLNTYYQHPQSEKIVQAAYGLSQEDYFSQPGGTATAIGFFATVFAQNPGKVDAWFNEFRHFPLSDQRVLASALWYSGNPKGEALLRQLSRDVDAENRGNIERLLSTPAVAVVDSPVRSDQSVNLQWGAFLATGEARPVSNILAAIGRGQVGETARLSLAFNAAQHDRVLEICRAELDKQPNEVRSVLRAVINDAESKKQQPTS
jgi:hypothetical protein